MPSLQTTVEGNTKLVVPIDSLTSEIPPRNPAFFNPNARVSRDFSIIAYKSYVKNLNEKSMADAFAGVGARAIRTAVEIKELDQVYINDANPIAIDMARESSKLNNIEKKCTFSVNDVCKFLIEHSSKGSRLGMIDLDPFGTPAPYIDCVLRAIKDEGLLSITATDTPVLCGIYPDVCTRRYYGRSMNVEYGNEIGLRLLLGLISMVASRLELGIKPLFVHSIRNYLRVYVRVNVGSRYAESMPSKLGYIHHCFSCSSRTYTNQTDHHKICDICNKPMRFAGPLWIEKIFDPDFIDEMLYSINDCNVDKKCYKILSLAREETNMPPTYFSIDKISERMKATPPTMSTMIDRLQSSGFSATRTSLRFTGFKTNAKYNEILDLFRTLVA
ncbi:MAG: tRNA (guanine(10)-N(2))-dimethyltransferase [Thaumarchaeota archaeon]|nr:tRNA (guanine(10)-N(2))-dimethyltransferase [Nitrososphaerota archaeon]